MNDAKLRKPAEPYKYQARIEAAKRWLGKDYLLAKPVTLMPMFLRKQAD